MGGEGHARNARQPHQFHFSRDRRTGRAPTQDGSQISARAGSGAATRELLRLTTRRFCLSDTGSWLAFSFHRRSAAPARRESGPVPPHHAVALPFRGTREAAANVEKVLVVELSNGQMVEDVRLALDGTVPVDFYGRGGGNVPSVKELQEQVLARMGATV